MADGSQVKDDTAFVELSIDSRHKECIYYAKLLVREALDDVMNNGGTLVVSREGTKIQLIQRRKPIE